MDARTLWQCFEPYHAVTYFTPESIAETDALGCKGRWMGYFGMRAAPLGAAPAWLVESLFYTFHRSRVERAVPEVWTVATPEEFLAARLRGVDGALRRLLGDDVVTGPDIAEAAELAVAAAGWMPTAARALGAANAVLPLPAEPHLALWQATTTLREARGDGHNAALVTAGLEPVEAAVAIGADRGLDAAYLRAARQIPEDEWAAAESALLERGVLAAPGELTEEGRELRETVETLTDEAASAPWQQLGDTATARFAALMAPVSLRIAEGNDVMRVNPMGLAPTARLTDLVGGSTG